MELDKEIIRLSKDFDEDLFFLLLPFFCYLISVDFDGLHGTRRR